MQWIHRSEDLERLASTWNALLQSSATNVPFLRHEYLHTWWRTLGGGEWPHGELAIALDRDANGQLRGIAPLFLTENLEGRPALMFLGSIEISDYLDFIAPTGHLRDFLLHLLDALDTPTAPSWEVLDLYNLPDWSPTPDLLEELAAARGWRVTREVLQPAPYIPLPDSWEAYLAQVKKKQRHEIRRKLRRAAGHTPPARWYIVEEESRLDAEIEALFNLMAYDEKKATFLTQVMRSQMRAAVHTAFRAGWLQLAFLTVGEEKAAAYLNFDYANQIWVYNSGLNPSFTALSPGWVLLAHLIQWAIDQGRTAFDFMRGDEAYKYRFGAVNRYVLRLRIER